MEGDAVAAAEWTRAECERLDQEDPLSAHRARFRLPPGLIYLDGNSLGPLPAGTQARVSAAIGQEWGVGLIGSWNNAGWIGLPQRVGAKIASLVGAGDDEVIAADSTSINLFKVLAAALQLRPDRRTILSERENFPTDLYIAQGLIGMVGNGYRLELVGRDELEHLLASDEIRKDVAVTMLTQVDYRDGSRLDMDRVTELAHAAGSVVVWDLAHSAGAFPVDLNGAGADFAVGCGYKYLNGGPGAPAFLFVARKHQSRFNQPLSGWMGHARPFEFSSEYAPAQGISRYLCGTPSVLALTALDEGLDVLIATQAHGGLAALEAKAARLTECFIDLVEDDCAGFGMTLVTPREPRRRGNQVSFAMPDGDQAYAVVQALIARGVVGDFRAPNILRFGFAPLYLRLVDAWDAAEHLAEVLQTREWDQPRFLQRQAVT
ncbi:MAG TPA: kynureninase [Lautropia sp.]|nr:kynureninase [Lautropia sp.]